MGTLANNKWYVVMGGVDVSSQVIDVDLTRKNAAQDTTMGSQATHVEQAAGLNSTELKLRIGWASGGITTYIQKLAPGSDVEIEIGLELNLSGKPRHKQYFLITDNNIKKNVSKAPVGFDITASGSAAPTYDMFAGDVYP